MIQIATAEHSGRALGAVAGQFAFGLAGGGVCLDTPAAACLSL